MKESMIVNYYEIDGKDYLVVNELDYNSNHYIYLINELDSEDMMVRKIINERLEPLETEEELVEVLKLLIK